MKRAKKWKMSPDAINLVAARFKVLAEPLRLQVLQQLETGNLSVTDLANAVGTTQPNVSKHLKILQDGGLVARKQEGNTVFYSIADESVLELCDVVCGSLKEKFAQRSAMFG
ncbi:MAG: metalloregulator ArsR/SmtB family transcription factor [Pyrinomonadaceae bacterium]